MGRRCGGTLAQSCPSKTILPPLSFSSPAMHRKIVVLPAPDGPKRIVVEGPAEMRSPASTRNPLLNCLSMSAISSKEPHLPVKSVNDGKNHERYDEEDGGSYTRSGIIQRLYLIVDVDRKSSSHTRNIAANHQYDAEFSQSMSKTQNDTRQDARPG